MAVFPSHVRFSLTRVVHYREDVRRVFVKRRRVAASVIRTLDAKEARDIDSLLGGNPQLSVRSLGDAIVQEEVSHDSVVPERLLRLHHTRVECVVAAKDRIAHRLADAHSGPAIVRPLACAPVSHGAIDARVGCVGLDLRIALKFAVVPEYRFESHGRGTGRRVGRATDEKVKCSGVVDRRPHPLGLGEALRTPEQLTQADRPGNAVKRNAPIV